MTSTASWSTSAGTWGRPWRPSPSTSARTAPTARSTTGWAAAPASAISRSSTKRRASARSTARTSSSCATPAIPRTSPGGSTASPWSSTAPASSAIPTRGGSDGKGSLRGHLAAGARVVVNSSPFKSKLKGVPLPDDAVILINGINHFEFDPGQAQDGVGSLLHHHRPRPHDAAAAGPRPHPQHDHGRHEHRPRRHQQPAGARRRAGGRRHRPAQDPLGRWTTSSSPRPTPPRPSSRSCPRSPASASWPTRCASPPPPSV